MAKSKNGSMSQEIRDYLKKNPKATAKDVVAGLKDEGVYVKEGLVYAVKGGMKERKRRKKRVIRAAKAAAGGFPGNGVVGKTDALTMIREVKALALKAGGYGKLKELVEAMAQ